MSGRCALRAVLVVALLAAHRAHASDLFQVGDPEALAGGGVGEGGLALEVSMLPQDVAVGPDQTVYIADEQFNRIRAVGPDGRVRTVAGSGAYGFDGDDRPALESSLYVPTSVTFGPDGRLYIVDLGNRRVRRLEADGRLTTAAGPQSRVLAAASQPFAPAGLAVDPQGRICVADRANHRVWQLDPDGKGRPVAGSGERGFSGDGGPSALARLADPRAVAIGPDGAIYVADFGNRRVRRVGADGVIQTIAGNGREDGWQGDRSALEASLRPSDLDLDRQGRLLVLDDLGPRVLRLEPDGSLTTLATLPPGSQPGGAAVDGQGRVLVAEYGARQVVRIGLGGAGEVVAGNGRIRASGDGDRALNASLYQPLGLAWAPDGGLLIADRLNHLVRRLRPDGTLERVAGTGEPGYRGDGAPAVEAGLYQPSGVAVDPQGRLFIADELNHRVRRVDPDGRITTVAGTGEPGFAGDGGPADQARLRNPVAVALDARLRLYIADLGNRRIRCVDPDGTMHTVAGNGGSGPPPGGGPAAESALDSPADVAADRRGDLWIADAGAHQVYRLAADGSLRVIAGTGQPGQGADGSLAGRSALSRPLGVAPDGVGGVFVADSGNGRVVHVDGSGVLRVVRAGIGQPVRVVLDPRGGLAVSELSTYTVVHVPVARRLAEVSDRVLAPSGWRVESLAASDASGLQQVVWDPLTGRAYLSHANGVDEVLPDGGQRPWARLAAGAFRALVSPPGIGPGLLVAGAAGSAGDASLLWLRAGASGAAAPASLPYAIGAVAALARPVDGSVLAWTEGGRLWRLGPASGQVRQLALLPAGAGALAAGATGEIYLARRDTRELLWLVDLNGDGVLDGPGEQARLATLDQEPVALAWQDGLYLALADGTVHRLADPGGLRLFAAGFAPAILDLTAAAGGLCVLEGDGGGGRLVLLRPPAPVLAVWPAVLDYGSQEVAGIATRRLTLRNDGTLPLRLTSQTGLGLAARTAAEVRLAPGEARQVEVEITPSRRGPTVDTLRWRQDDGTVALALPLKVRGLGPVLALSSEPVAFGTVRVGAREVRTVWLRNVGETPLRVRQAGAAAPFSVAYDSAAAVPPGGQAAVTVTMQPRERRVWVDSLCLVTDDPSQPVRWVRLEGRGGQPVLADLPSQLDLGTVPVGGVGFLPLRLRNAGELPLRVEQIASDRREVVASGLAVVVPAGGTAAVDLQFRPRRHGPVTGGLSLATDDPARGQVRLPFAGQGVSSVLRLGEASHRFAPVPVGRTQPWALALANRGARSIALLEAACDDPQFRVAAAPSALGPGATAVVRVEFRPAYPGTARGRLLLRTDLPEAPVIEIPLEGRGQAPTRVELGPVVPVAVWPGEPVEVPIRLVRAQRLDGIALDIRLPSGSEYAGMAFPPGSLLAGSPRPLIVADPRAPDRLELAISLVGRAGPSGLDGDGLLGLLRLRFAAAPDDGRELSIPTAYLHSALGLTDTVAQTAAVVVSVRLLGDLDGDGDLDADDRAALAARLGRPPTGTNAPFDLNRDGRIDPADLELLEAHLGTRAAARVARADSLPPAVRLWPGYPNPANAQIELVYELPSAQPVALVVSDILGRRVRVLVDQLQEPGIHRLVWDGRDDSGRPAASGVYTALLRAPAAALTQRLVLLR